MGELAFKRGAMYDSAEAYQEALRLLGWYVLACCHNLNPSAYALRACGKLKAR